MNYPNGRHMSRNPVRSFGPGPGLEPMLRNRSDSMNRYIGQTWLKTAGTPDGYGMIGLVPAIRSGSMSAIVRAIVVNGTGALLQGGPMEGSGSWSLSGDNMSLGLNVNLNGTSTVTVSGDGMILALTIGLDGTGTWTLEGDGNNLAMIVPFDGTGSWALNGTSDLRGRMTMQGEWTPFSELSPESLAGAVWAAVAGDNNEPGTMGEKLNGAGSAGNPWTEVIESGLTAAEVMRIILAVNAGKSEADGTTIKFKAQDGTTDRVSATMTGNERTAVTLEGS